MMNSMTDPVGNAFVHVSPINEVMEKVYATLRNVWESTQ